MTKQKTMKQRTVRGVITVEMSYLIPLILLVFVLVIYAAFYFHDKNILIGAAAETAVVRAQAQRWPDGNDSVDMETVFRERSQGKLILFSGVSVSESISGKWVQIEASAENGNMALHVIQKAAIAEPEKKIRRARIWSNQNTSQD